MTNFASHSNVLLFYERQCTSTSNVRKINVHVTANCVTCSKILHIFYFPATRPSSANTAKVATLLSPLFVFLLSEWQFEAFSRERTRNYLHLTLLVYQLIKAWMGGGGVTVQVELVSSVCTRTYMTVLN